MRLLQPDLEHFQERGSRRFSGLPQPAQPCGKGLLRGQTPPHTGNDQAALPPWVGDLKPSPRTLCTLSSA